MAEPVFDPLPEKAVRSKREKDITIRKRSGRSYEEEQLRRGVDGLCVEAGRTRRADFGVLPETRNHKSESQSRRFIHLCLYVICRSLKI